MAAVVAHRRRPKVRERTPTQALWYPRWHNPTTGHFNNRVVVDRVSRSFLNLVNLEAVYTITRMIESRTHAFEDWRLTPEGAAIHPGEQTAVVADVHLGYEWARGAAGDCVIAHSLDETLARLALVLAHLPVTRLIVAGDLVESPRPCRRTRDDVRRLREWLAERGVSLLVLEGNHDRSLSRAPGVIHRSQARCLRHAWWQAGRSATATVPIRGERTVSGHHHPVLRVERIVAPCFLVGPSEDCFAGVLVQRRRLRRCHSGRAPGLERPVPSVHCQHGLRLARLWNAEQSTSAPAAPGPLASVHRASIVTTCHSLRPRPFVPACVFGGSGGASASESLKSIVFDSSLTSAVRVVVRTSPYPAGMRPWPPSPP